MIWDRHFAGIKQRQCGALRERVGKVGVERFGILQLWSSTAHESHRSHPVPRPSFYKFVFGFFSLESFLQLSSAAVYMGSHVVVGHMPEGTKNHAAYAKMGGICRAAPGDPSIPHLVYLSDVGLSMFFQRAYRRASSAVTYAPGNAMPVSPFYPIWPDWFWCEIARVGSFGANRFDIVGRDCSFVARERIEQASLELSFFHSAYPKFLHSACPVIISPGQFGNVVPRHAGTFLHSACPVIISPGESGNVVPRHAGTVHPG